MSAERRERAKNTALTGNKSEREVGKLEISENEPDAKSLDKVESLAQEAVSSFKEPDQRILDYVASKDKNVDLDILRIYLSDIRKNSLLTANDVIELAKEKDSGNIKARNQLIESNLRLVVFIAKNYIGDRFQFLDLIQAGNEGLFKAVDKFKWRKGYRFSTYATWWIRNSIQRGIMEKVDLVRLPHNKYEDINKVKRVQKEHFGATPINASGIADETGFNESQVKKLLTLMERNVVSLDNPIGEDGDETFHDKISSEITESPIDEINILQQYENMIKALDIVSQGETGKRDKDIFVSHRGLYNVDPQSIAVLSKKYGLKIYKVKRIVKEYLNKLKELTNEKNVPLSKE